MRWIRLDPRFPLIIDRYDQYHQGSDGIQDPIPKITEGSNGIQELLSNFAMGSDWIMDPILHLVERSSGITDSTFGSTDTTEEPETSLGGLTC